MTKRRRKVRRDARGGGGRAAPFAPRILHEDEHLIAVDKPAGLLSVPLHGGERNLLDLLRRRARPDAAEVLPVHRLDRDTSGVIVFARNASAQRALEAAFRERRVRKSYLALVIGKPHPARGKVESSIVDRGAHATSHPGSVRGGKPAVTRYRVVESWRDASLVACEPETGRFNQIRLHMADLGHPLVGERKYAMGSRARVKFKRPLLHAASLDLSHPVSGAPLHLEAALPDDFARLLETLS